MVRLLDGMWACVECADIALSRRVYLPLQSRVNIVKGHALLSPLPDARRLCSMG